MNTTPVLNPNKGSTECNLCVMRIGSNNEYLPLCLVGGSPFGARWRPYERWWNQEVIRDDQRRLFSRKDLILNVADTDGGAHVDPELDEAYVDLSRNNSLGWTIQEGDIQRPFPPPTMSCVRQIAHEVLETLKSKASKKVSVEYEPITDA